MFSLLLAWGAVWQIIDPLIRIFIVVVILTGTWSLLRDSVNRSLDSVLKGVDIEGITTYLNGLEY